MNTKTESVSSPKRLARIAGLPYLIVGIFGGFAVAYVTPMLYVPGAAAATVLQGSMPGKQKSPDGWVWLATFC